MTSVTTTPAAGSRMPSSTYSQALLRSMVMTPKFIPK
jgi:hypothetical protein